MPARVSKARCDEVLASARQSRSRSRRMHPNYEQCRSANSPRSSRSRRWANCTLIQASRRLTGPPEELTRHRDHSHLTLVGKTYSLIRNQQVRGSNPRVGSIFSSTYHMNRGNVRACASNA